MNYQEAQNTVLKLSDRYSVAGSPMAMSYNGQADFLVKIPPFLDDAMGVIATTVGKLRKTVPIAGLARDGDWYRLPEDCMRACPLNVEGAWFPDESHLAIPDGTGAYLTYYRRPTPLGENPDPAQELDGTEEMQRAALYYAAAYLMLHEDDFAHKALLTEWERHLGRLATLPRAETGTVQNVYGEVEV